MTEGPTILELGPAAQRLTALLSGVTGDQLPAPTPCEDWAVGDLLDHIMGLTLAFRDAARKSTVLQDESRSAGSGPPPGPSADNLDPEWRSTLPRRLDELVAAWKDPSAWEGMTEAGGVSLPGSVAGVVAADELVVHGWDLARATGQAFSCDPVIEEALFEFLSQSVAEERRGIFGPVVEVPAGAPLLDRIVGLAGRDPRWRPRR